MTNKENPYVLTDEVVIVDTYRHADDSLSFAPKVKTAVRVTHKITGIQVTCSSEVSVQRNKEKAMEELANKLAELGGDAESLPKQPKKATVLAYRVCGWHNSLHHTKNHALHHVKQMYSGDEAVVIQQLMDVGEHELIMDRLRGQYDALREERDAALASVTSLESKLAELEKQKEFGHVIVSMKGGYKCFEFDEYSHAHSFPEGEHQLYASPVAQAQHSVPEEFIGRLSEFLAQRGATGKALLRELRDMLAAAPARGQHSVPDDVETFLDEVRAELLRARSKFPGDRIMTIALAEEFGELCKAVLDEPAANVRKEAVQTAVMAARVVLDGDGSVTAWRSERGLDPLTGATGKEGSNE
ncbi:peptide chain release factor 1 [Pseudomonas phage Iggy]|uniref:Peptide chain release factor 1 n=2 Tax=Viruses TaxID=10239 RepID=A0A7S5E9V5_9CAUD|nr:peptide chain release factor 1 [Pseudomonas phage Iggy]QEA09758.1 peptide chain release factor 1 [Pseudomonas phage Iggy]